MRDGDGFYGLQVEGEGEQMKVTIRKGLDGVLTAYIAKKDLEQPILAADRGDLWGGCVTLANGWRLQLPELAPDTPLPVTVEAQRLADGVGGLA